MNEEARTRCHACGQHAVELFYELRQVPVQSVLLFPTRAEAVGMPKGDLLLGFCPSCGFIGNQAFDPALIEFSSRYEETQGFSATFTGFHTDLATRLVERFHLRDKKVLEIGCGKGEFLTLLCEIGNNSGVGFDPVYDETRTISPAKERMTFVKEFYSERHADVHADLVCCKMTLEHIAEPLEFMQMIRKALGTNLQTRIFFQIPDVTKILREGAFWDIYYEHCSYLSPVSLEGLFRRAGFSVNEVWTEYDDQYLMIDACPSAHAATTADAMDHARIYDLHQTVKRFVHDVTNRIREWNTFLSARAQKGQRMVIWGAGSKGVGFLTSMEMSHEITYAVDVNPHKHGTYLAGTGQEIVPPEFLRTYRPDVVIVMNPVYCDEIRASLAEMRIVAELVPLGA
jgi:SAM-dependent methyltransferase